MEDLLGRQDRLDRRFLEPADPPQRISYLRGLRLGLSLVREILKAAASAGRVMLTRRVDAQRARLQHLGRERFRVASLHLGHPRAHRVTGKAAPHEDDEAVQSRDAVAAVRE